MITDRKPSASASIIASAIVAILGSLLTILLAGLGFLGTLFVRSGAAAPTQPPGTRAISLIFLVIILAFGIFGIFSAVGLWRLRNWARMAFLIYSGAMVCVCAFALVFVWFVLPSLPKVQPQAVGFVHVFLVLIYGIPIGIGVWWLVLLNRKDVARQFTSEGMLQGDGAASIAAKPRCPLPIAILACFQLFSACWMPMLLLLPVSIPAVLFGHAIFGRPAAIIYAVLGITLALCAIGLLLLKKWSYSLLIGYHVFYSASGLVGLLSPNTWTVMNEMMSKWQTPRYSGPQFPYSHTQYVATSIGGLSLTIVILGLSIYYRAAFYEQSDRNANANLSATVPPAVPPPAPPELAS